MERGEHRQVGRALFEHLVEVPDLEMIAHADQQGTLGHGTAGAQPRCDRDPPPAVEPGRRDEPERTAPCRVAGLRVVVRALRTVDAMTLDDAGTIVDDHARRLVMRPDEQMVVHRPRLDRDTESVVQWKTAANADA